MHMHPANQHAAGNTGQIAIKVVVTILVGVMLVLPVAKRMARGRNRGQSMVSRMTGDRLAQMPQIRARFGYGLAYAGTDLDLAFQEFGADLTFQISLSGIHQRIRRSRQSAGLPVYKQVFLLDANRKRRIRARHLPHLSKACSQQISNHMMWQEKVALRQFNPAG